MKETGIPFKSDMVTAILAGRKNQTRRIIKPQPDDTHHWRMFPDYKLSVNLLDTTKGNVALFMDCANGHIEENVSVLCRYGQKGDLLYVKETWAETTNVNAEKNWPGRPCKITDSDGDETYSAIIYRADGHWEWCDGDGFLSERSYWKSPLFLKKKDARIWLRNTGVRVERLTDIDPIDAIGEGIEPCETGWRDYKNPGAFVKKEFPEHSFRTLIQSIHGPEVWEENPFVFVIDFEILSTTGRPKNI